MMDCIFKKYKKSGLLFMVMTLLSIASYAQVKFSLNAPSQVAEGSQFRVVFSVNAQGSNLKVPPFSGFSMLSGPNQSQSSSTQIFNGQTSTQVEISYSYILEAGKMGKYTIGQASIVVNGKTYKTNPQTIEVVKGNPRQAQSKGNPQQQQQQTQATISPNDLFLRAIPSKTSAYQGEEVLVLYKLYFAVPIVQYGMTKLPSSTGFWSNELTDKKAAPRQYSENYNGKNYNVADLRKIAIYAQKSGKLTINPLNMDLVVQLRQQRQRQSFWDNFFSDIAVQNVKKELNSNSVNIQVIPFPEPRPDGFLGAVGNYNVSCTIDKTNAKTNDAITISLTVKGKGNLSLLDPPVFEFPSDFEVYDPKIKDNIVTSLSGVSGSRTFEYLVIPRNPGKFDIKSINFVFFNPDTKAYSTFKTPTFSLNIEKGNGYNPSTASNLTNQKDIKYLGSDIHFIKTNTSEFSVKNETFFLSLTYLLIIFGIAAIFIALVIYFRKQIIMRKDLKLMRNKRASKLAHKRLSKASVFMKEQKKEAFFIEISQVIWGFVADKCNIQVSQLSMDSIRAELEKIDTDPQIISDFVTLLNDCEFARFAPGDPKDLMQQFYDRAFNAIITLEKSMKTIQKTSNGDMNKKAFLMLVFMSILFANYAQVEPSFKKANDAYIAKKYEEAATQYQAIYEQGKTSAALCYNLGNCFFKQNDFAKSILWYERAKRLAPSDEDIDFNLNVARLKIIDKSDRVPVLFIVEWWNSYLHLFSATAWAWISIFVFIAFLSVLAVFLFSNSFLFRKTSFYGFIILFVLFAMSVIAAFNQRNSILNTSEIIVMQPTCNVKSSPDENSTLLFVVHEGLKAKIVDEIGEWIEIKLDNGTKGWVKKADAEVI